MSKGFVSGVNMQSGCQLGRRAEISTAPVKKALRDGVPGASRVSTARPARLARPPGGICGRLPLGPTSMPRWMPYVKMAHCWVMDLGCGSCWIAPLLEHVVRYRCSLSLVSSVGLIYRVEMC